MKFMTIASGSSGNCSLIGSDKASLLLDAGVSRKKIQDGLKTCDMTLDDIDGILVTHEHIDHVRAIGVISRNKEIPIYATQGTCEALKACSALGEFDFELLKPISVEQPFFIGDIEVTAHSTWHDASDPVCYSLINNNKKVSVATDMGDYNDYIVDSLKESDILLIEANHDIRMLQAGSYPYKLKQRILGRYGHLSNEAGGRLIKSLLNAHINSIFLGHLSNENNHPELAYEAVKLELMGNKYSDDVRNFNLQVAKRDTYGTLIDI